MAVLWVTGLAALMAGAYAVSVRSHVRIVANTAESARAEALADAGIGLAILDLLSIRKGGTSAPRFSHGGAMSTCSVPGEGLIGITIRDEEGKVDLNTAGAPLLASLFIGVGETPSRALALAERVMDFRDSDSDRRANGAESPEYEGAGEGWKLKNGSFEAVEEIRLVLGMPSELVEKILPFVTIYSGRPSLDARAAQSRLLDLIKSGFEAAPALAETAQMDDREHLLTLMLDGYSSKRTFHVEAEAVTDTGSRFVREAVVAFNPGRAAGWTIRRWHRGGAGKMLHKSITAGKC